MSFDKYSFLLKIQQQLMMMMTGEAKKVALWMKTTFSELHISESDWEGAVLETPRMTPREQYLRWMNKDDDNEADDKDEYYYDEDKCDEEPTGLNSFVLRFSSPSSSSNV